MLPLAPVVQARRRFWGTYLNEIIAEKEVKDPGIILHTKNIFNATGSDDSFSEAIIDFSLIHAISKDQNIPIIEAQNIYNDGFESPEKMKAKRLLKITEQDIFKQIILYYRTGAHNIIIGQHLSEEFTHTDVDDITCEELSFPYKQFYLKFEGIEGRLADGSLLDGFMIINNSKGMGISPMTSDDLPITRDLMNGRIGPHLQFNLSLEENPKKTIKEMIENIIEVEKQLYDSLADDLPESLSREWVTKTYIDQKEGITLIEQQIPVWIRLIVNALMTIDTSAVSAQDGYPEGAPQELVEKSLSKRPGANKADKKLKALGWTRIKRYDVPSQRIEGTEGDKTVTPHWRRGHWRRQHHGPGKTLVKRIRIAPVIVNAKIGEPKQRKGYKVESSQVSRTR